MKKLTTLTLLFLIHLSSFSQENLNKSDTLRKDALNVFMESTDYIRREIPYINYVRDIRDAAVYIISTSQRTGSGGREYTYFLVGQHEFAGMADTISFVTVPDETTEGYRAKEVSTLKMGLMRYIARTPLAKYMNISFSQPLSETVSTDKWNSWVFKSNVSGYAMGQKTYKYNYLSGNISAARITNDWKINLNARYYKNTQKYIIDESTVESVSDSKYVTGLLVRSLSDHWSTGGMFRVGTSTYSNEKLGFSFAPGIE